MHEASVLGCTAAWHFWGMMGSVGGRGWSVCVGRGRRAEWAGREPSPAAACRVKLT